MDAAMSVDSLAVSSGLDPMEIERFDADASSAVSSLVPFPPPSAASVHHSIDLDMEYDEQPASSQPGIDSQKQDYEMEPIAEDKGDRLADVVTTDVEIDLEEDTTGMPEDHAEQEITTEATLKLEEDYPTTNEPEYTALDHPVQTQAATFAQNTALQPSEPTQQESDQPNNNGLPEESTNQEITSLTVNDESTTDTLETKTEPPQDEAADATEPHSEPVASTSALLPDLSTNDSTSRPTLQKDYLSAIELPHFYSGDSQSASTSFVPHVSLIYQDLEYSLFRPSSVPSGDDEEVLFGESEAQPQGSASQSLYYAPLSALIESLHLAFPTLKGDGEFEAVLDFGFLDMQVSQDNVYCHQVSLFDLDRIRMGLCQPEFDRLQVTLKGNKRFAFRFNELAEHCYRMFAGSDDDSGTIYEEQIEPDHATATEDVEDTAASRGLLTEEAAEAVEAEGVPDEQSASLEQLQETASDAPNETVAPPASTSDDAVAQELHDEEAQNEEGALDDLNLDAHGDVQPPSDEHYVDPEFVQDVGELEEYVEEEADEETVQADEANGIEGEKAYEDAPEQEEEYIESEVPAEETQENGQLEAHEVVETGQENEAPDTNDIVSVKDANGHDSINGNDKHGRKRSLDEVEQHEIAEGDAKVALDSQSTDLNTKRTKLDS